MDFLTLDLIKRNCRIEWYSKDHERQRKIDETIKKCANIAEGLVYEHIGKDYFSIMKEYGEIPVAIMQAALIATSDIMLEQDPEEDYALKMMLKPYKKRE